MTTNTDFNVRSVMKTYGCAIRCFLFLILSLLCSTFPLFAQLRYPVVGTYKNCSAQGMAIWGDNAFLLSDGGRCRVYDLLSQKVTREFMLASAGKGNHVNCASFGVEYAGGNRVNPVLYVSECKKPYRCFVENISDNKSELVQTIMVDSGTVVHDWVVDRKERMLYAVARLNRLPDDTLGMVVHRITKYRLPQLDEGTLVKLSQSDILEHFEVVFPNLLQGAAIRDKYLYLPAGLHAGNEKRKDARRALIVVNLDSQQVERTVDLSAVTVNEPEDCDFHKGKLLIYCGQTGGIYVINGK